MNPKTGVAGAVAALIVLFATGPLAATQAQAFGGFGGFHRCFGFGFPGFGFGGCGGCGGCF